MIRFTIAIVVAFLATGFWLGWALTSELAEVLRGLGL